MGITSLKNIQIPSFNLPFLNKQKLSVGLDIGSHAIKLCEFTEEGRGYRLRSLGSALLPPDSLEDGALQDPE
ncbi:MAG: pilus assembly protein PilM, partial [Desulfobulbaceae bacterium]|nr:pilus assembly protein PilM [Desulfobulbaceae bacterium]